MLSNTSAFSLLKPDFSRDEIIYKYVSIMTKCTDCGMNNNPCITYVSIMKYQ